MLNPPPMSGNYGSGGEIYGSSSNMNGMGPGSSFSGSGSYQGNSYGFGGYGYMPHGYSSYGSSSVTFFDFFFFFCLAHIFRNHRTCDFYRIEPFYFYHFIFKSQEHRKTSELSFPYYFSHKNLFII